MKVKEWEAERLALVHSRLLVHYHAIWVMGGDDGREALSGDAEIARQAVDLGSASRALMRYVMSRHQEVLSLGEPGELNAWLWKHDFPATLFAARNQPGKSREADLGG